MAKHRELAQVVYASTLGRTSPSRIFRTVVMAGAMLGAPLAAAETPPPPAKEAKKEEAKPAPVDKAAAAKAAKENVKAIELEIKEHDKKIAATNKEMTAAKDQAARDAAKTKLDEQKKQKDELKTKLAAAKEEHKKADAEAKAEAKAKKPRPRVQESRPVGRGFILS